jgi:hypothetical protein
VIAQIQPCQSDERLVGLLPASLKVGVADHHGRSCEEPQQREVVFGRRQDIRNGAHQASHHSASPAAIPTTFENRSMMDATLSVEVST